jgi:hypothetical protein
MLPTMTFSPRERKSFNSCSRSASRIFCADAADGQRLDRLFDVVIDLDVGDLLLRFEEQDLGVGDLQAGLVGHHVPAAECVVVAGLAVDRHADIDLAAMQLLRRLRKRSLNGAEHRFTRHAFLARDGVHQHEHFAVHLVLTLRQQSRPA